MANQPFRCVVHGSFRRHFAEIRRAIRLFQAAGIEVLAPKDADLVDCQNGFAVFAGEQELDQRLVELLYLQNLRHLGNDGFSYFVNPEGYLGRSASYELGIAQVTNVPCFFAEPLQDHPAYLHANSVWSPENLVDYIATHSALPEPQVERDERRIHRLWESLIVPGSLVAVGGIIEFDNPKSSAEKEILLVQTHKWGNRFSMVGGRVRRHETLTDALKREIKEETGLDARIGKHLCTFDQIKKSGYYKSGLQHIFVDNVVQVKDRKVQLNEEAQDYVWLPAKQALAELDIEPNARLTLELYAKMAA